MAKRDFMGKSVFITGTGSGIGYEVALAFAGAGADIVATDVNQDGLDKLRPEVERFGVDYRSDILNVADEGSLPDIVVNNAGIAFLDSFANTSSKQWRLTLDVNVLGVAWGSRIFINLWPVEKRGAQDRLLVERPAAPK